MKQRDLSLDFIRIFACLLVIICHAPLPSREAHSSLLTFIGFATACCIGLFFMISGALLLPAKAAQIPPPLPLSQFFKRRLRKVLIPTLVWTLFYIAFYAIKNHAAVIDVAVNVLSIPFSVQGSGILWFIYALVGLYLLVPVLSPWLQQAGEKEERFYLILWAVSLCYPMLSQYLYVDNGTGGTLYYFTGYVGYFVLGHYLNHYGNRLRLRTCVALFVGTFFVPLILKATHWSGDYSAVNQKLTIFVAVQCPFWWKVLHIAASRLRLGEKMKGKVVQMANLTFGVYLAHPLFLYIFKNNDFIVNLSSPLLQIVIVVICVLFCSLVVSWLFSISPLGNVMVGYKQKKAT